MNSKPASKTLALALAFLLCLTVLPSGMADTEPTNTAVSTGYNHTCVLKSNGNVDCYGDNTYGQAAGYAGGDATAVEAGMLFTCILKTNGNVHCYGYDAQGQAEDYNGGDAIAVAVPSHGYESCILKSNHTVDCRGAPDYNGGDAVQVSVGDGYECYLKTNANVDCVGYNSAGQADDYTGGDAVAVSAGEDHTCVLKSNGNVHCYGHDDYSDTTDYTGGDVVSLPPREGYRHTCFLLSSGNVECRGEATQSTDYTAGDAAQVSVGFLGTCILRQDTSVHCWGYNNYGENNDYTPPSSPRSLTAVSSGTTQVTLAWTASASAGSSSVAHYDIYRGTARGAETYITQVGNVLTFTDIELTAGRTYYYKVSAVSGAGEGPLSNEASAAPSGVPCAPLDLTATAGPGAGQVSLAWTAGCTGTAIPVTYSMYRSTSAAGLATASAFATGVTSTSYVDMGRGNGATWYYAVTAVNSLGASQKSDPASATTFTLPCTPSGLTATAGPGGGQISLSWTGCADPSVTYSLYRSTSAAGLATASAFITGVTATSYVDMGRGNGATWYYAVTAVNAVGASAKSNIASATTFSLPCAPTGLGATAGPGAGEISLSWSAACTGGTSVTYSVYRSTSAAGLATASAFATGVTSTSYVDTGRGNGVTWYYAVTAVNAAGASAKSNTASATTFAVPCAPQNLIATPGPSIGQTSLSWSAPSCDGGTPLTGYAIYRAIGSAPLALYASVVPTPTSFVDAPTYLSKTYHYVVKATNVVGEGSPSGEAIAQGTAPDGGTLPQCMDGVDNDGDTYTDYRPTVVGGGDPDCTNAADNKEATDNQP
jgi:fibronectin type 3 domain-containing protein